MSTIKVLSAVLLLCVHHNEGSESLIPKVQSEKSLAKYDKKSVVCYFTNWSAYRQGRAKFRPENIDPTLCTHINYAFASLDENSLTIQMFDPNLDQDKKFYQLVTAYKKQNVTVLISIGGWTDSKTKWRSLINNPEARSKFVTSAIKFLEDNNFDGLDMDYEYPGCPQGKVSSESAADSENFNKLLAELKTAFNGRYLLTAATAAGKNLIDKCSNMGQMCELLDWINIMTYDYHSYREGQAGAQSPMDGTGAQFGVYDTVKYYLQLGCPPEKIVVGMNFASKTYTLDGPPAESPQFGDKTSGPGTAGPFTKAAGTLAYYETCYLIKTGRYHQGYSKANGSFAWLGDQFVSYVGLTDVKATCSLINAEGLRGAMVWALPLDDFNAMCDNISYPLLTAINNHLHMSGSSASKHYLFTFPALFCVLYFLY